MDGNGAKWAPIVSRAHSKASRGESRACRGDRPAGAGQGAKPSPEWSPRPSQLKDDGDGKTVASKTEFVWIDDALPAGATPQGEAVGIR